MPTTAIAAAFGLLLVGLGLIWWSRRRWTSRGLPRGRIVYSDTSQWEPLQKPLYSREFGLTGRPDYLVRVGRKAIVPVEVKSGPAPAEPYPGHVLQLAAYCLLVEEETGARPRYGLIHYGDATMRVEYDSGLERRLVQALESMREARGRRSLDRDHNVPQKCARCGQRDNCDQRLA